MALPKQFNNPFDYEPHALCVQASRELQELIKKTNWNHNFGLDPDQEGKGIGKMFGVLIVRNKREVGYLAGFSGKIGESNHFDGFVPPIFDGLEGGGFLETGMKELTRINQKIAQVDPRDITQINRLKNTRTAHSNSLQDQIYDSYQFLNGKGETKGLRAIFETERHTKPPGGAGDCAAPRLLQYAFTHEMKPLAMAEFWWGHSDDSPQWQHQQFYPSCTHKCEPILKHMIVGVLGQNILNYT